MKKNDNYNPIEKILQNAIDTTDQTIFLQLMKELYTITNSIEYQKCFFETMKGIPLFFTLWKRSTSVSEAIPYFSGYVFFASQRFNLAVMSDYEELHYI